MSGRGCLLPETFLALLWQTVYVSVVVILFRPLFWSW